VRASQLPTARRGADATKRRAAPDALVLGRYRLAQRLGAGSFGTVYRARDEHLEREVAVKVVPRERIREARFEREARAAARLSHPAIVTLYEAAADEESAYLVSELVRGATMGQLLEAGRLSDRDIVAIGIALCDALAHAHAQGVVHRDIKPSNILVSEQPASAGYPAKLTDFGVARVLGGDPLTKSGDVVGTAAYMAPEQAVGRPAAAPADLYALALVSYEALTGVNPVARGATGQRASRLGAHLPPLRRQRRDLPRELGRGIDLALRPRARERGTVEDLRRAMAAALAELYDVPGVVEAPWRRRLVRATRTGGGPIDRPLDRLDSEAEGRTIPRWHERALACACMALLAAWLTREVIGSPSIAPAAVALIAAAFVLVLPRLGFIAVTSALAAAALLRGHSGEALIVVVGALIPIITQPRGGIAWPLPVGAPALGVLGLAGAWPAFAAKAASAWRRAALGLTGWIWLLLATPLSGSALYLHTPTGLPSHRVWSSSLYETAHHVLAPLISSGALAAAPVWALAAVSLPYLTKRRSLALDAIRVAGWTGFVVFATELAVHASSPPSTLRAPDTAVLGAVAGALVALAPSVAATWGERRRSGEPRAGLS
jgi:hypothetical protein